MGAGVVVIVDTARSVVRLMRNAFRSTVGRADYKRWTSPGGLEEWWDERTRLLAGLVPAASKVIEFGAGRRQLEKYIPSDCAYVPSDLVDRGPGTIVCDLNRLPLPDLRAIAPTVAVFGGVLEYVKDVESLVKWLVSSGIQTCVLSFDSMPTDLGVSARLSELRRRTGKGYMNRLTESELKALFASAGMECVHERRWTTQGIYKFLRPQR